MNSEPIPVKSARMPDAGAFRRIASGGAEADALENPGRHSGKKQSRIKGSQKTSSAEALVR